MKSSAKDIIEVLIFVESRYQANRKRITSTVKDVLTRQGVKGPVEVSIAIVGDRKMRALSQKYKGEDKTRNILSFSTAEGDHVVMPTDRLRLGDIVISFPFVITEAAKMDMLVDDRIDELVEHGLMHLLGLHHE